MPVANSPAEAFLIDFHGEFPGLTAQAMGAVPVVFRGREFCSSYEVLARAVAESEAPLQVLDLACGDGFLLAALAARSQPGLELCGVDMSRSEMALARARLPARVALCQARSQKLPFVSTSFDCVLCHLALMLMDDVEQVLREVVRVMKPGATFAAVIGARPPPSAAFAAYVDVLARHPPQKAFAEVRFGDPRLRHPDGIHELLSRSLRNVLVEEIHTSRRLTPGELWRWFLNMYDLHLRSEADRRVIEREYMDSLMPHCGPDGRLEYREISRHISARA